MYAQTCVHNSACGDLFTPIVIANLCLNSSQEREMDRGGEVVVPWEHWVCSQCLRDNPYAVWLIKLRCFNPKRHQQYQWILVSIEPSSMKLVEMRPPPPDIERITAPIQLCQAQQNCQRENCPLPHSEVEYYTWDFIRTAFRGEITRNCLNQYNQARNICIPRPTDINLWVVSM